MYVKGFKKMKPSSQDLKMEKVFVATFEIGFKFSDRHINMKHACVQERTCMLERERENWNNLRNALLVLTVRQVKRQTIWK